MLTGISGVDGGIDVLELPAGSYYVTTGGEVVGRFVRH